MKGYKVWRNFREPRTGEVRRISLLGTWVNRSAATYDYQIFNRTFIFSLQVAGSGMLLSYLEGRGGPW